MYICMHYYYYYYYNNTFSLGVQSSSEGKHVGGRHCYGCLWTYDMLSSESTWTAQQTWTMLSSSFLVTANCLLAQRLLSNNNDIKFVSYKLHPKRHDLIYFMFKISYKMGSTNLISISLMWQKKKLSERWTFLFRITILINYKIQDF